MSAEASNKAESSSPSSSDSEEEVEPNSSQADPGQAACDQAKDQVTDPDPAAVSSLDSESSKEQKEDDDEPKQVSDPRLNPKYVVL